MYRSMETDLQGTPRRKPNNKALDAEPPIASFLESMLIGGGPVNANVRQLKLACDINQSNVRCGD